MNIEGNPVKYRQIFDKKSKKNPVFLQNHPQIFVKNSNFCEKFKFLWKIQIFVKNSNFRQTFKNQISPYSRYRKNARIFSRKFYPKMETMLKDRNSEKIEFFFFSKIKKLMIKYWAFCQKKCNFDKKSFIINIWIPTFFRNLICNYKL